MVEKSMMTDKTALLIVFLCFVFGIGIGIFTCIYFSKKVSFYIIKDVLYYIKVIPYMIYKVSYMINTYMI